MGTAKLRRIKVRPRNLDAAVRKRMIPEVMAWYYSKMGLQQGPVPEEELRAKIRRGEIDGTNLVWKDGMAEWKPLSQMPALMAPETTTDPAPLSNPETGWQRPAASATRLSW